MPSNVSWESASCCRAAEGRTPRALSKNHLRASSSMLIQGSILGNFPKVMSFGAMKSQRIKPRQLARRQSHLLLLPLLEEELCKRQWGTKKVGWRTTFSPHFSTTCHKHGCETQPGRWTLEEDEMNDRKTQMGGWEQGPERVIYPGKCWEGDWISSLMPQMSVSFTKILLFTPNQEFQTLYPTCPCCHMLQAS